jgi:hypothetical protein
MHTLFQLIEIRLILIHSHHREAKDLYVLKGNQKKSLTSPFLSKEEQRKKGKNKSLDIE